MRSAGRLFPHSAGLAVPALSGHGAGTTDLAGAARQGGRLARRADEQAAWFICGGSIVCVALGLTLYMHNRQTPGAGQFFDPVLPAIALTFSATGALVTGGRRLNPLAWVFSAGGLAAVSFFAEQYAVYALLAEPGRLPGGEWAAWLATWAWVPAYLGAFTLLPLLFPDGRLPSPHWRPVLWVVVACIAGTAVSVALAPENLTSPAPRNPLGIKAVPELGWVGVAICIFLLAPLCLTATVVRYRRSLQVARLQLNSFVVAAGVAVSVPLAALLFEFAGISVPIRLYQGLGVVSLSAMAGAAVVAMTKHGLYGANLSVTTFVNRALVLVGLGAVAAAAYVAVAAVLAALIPGQAGLAPAAVAIVVAAVVGRSMRTRLQAAVDRLLYRQRDYDYGVLASLGQRLRSTLGADAVLPVIAETVAGALKLPYVDVTVGRGQQVAASASYGGVHRDAVVLPLVHQGEVVGRLTVASADPAGGFDEADRRLLDELAAQVGIVAYALCLATDLQRSRERLVAAREEERRRLRRDLHDGLKPTLAGIALGLDAVCNIVSRDAPTAGSLLARLKAELDGAGADIRRLVHDLRPPALDELGLVGALRQHASRIQLSPTSPDVVLNAPAELCRLPAAVEVAAYRIGMEALENVRTHAHARSCEISLRVESDHLALEVRDDGNGLAPDRRAGVGLLAMQERAAELGGSCSVETLDGSGTCVRARLPLESP